MRNHLALALLLGLWLNPTSVVWAKKSASITPLEGSVYLTYPETATPIKLSKKTFVGQDGTLETRSSNRIKIETLKGVDLLVTGPFRIRLNPTNSLNKSVFRLLQGDVELKIKQGAKDRIISYRAETEVMEFDFASGVYNFFHDDLKGSTHIYVFKGDAKVRGKGLEDWFRLGEGYQTHFSALLQNGKPVFDELLAGQRMVRGNLAEPTEISPEELVRREAAKHQAALKRRKKTVKKAVRTPDQICDRPWGRFNECKWQCLNNQGQPSCRTDLKKVQCVEWRCNANGLWRERRVLSKKEGSWRCNGKKLVIAPCDS